MPSGPGALEGLILETAFGISSSDGMKIWSLSRSWCRGSPWVNVLVKKRCHLCCFGLLNGPFTLFKALYARKNCMGLISKGTGS